MTVSVNLKMKIRSIMELKFRQIPLARANITQKFGLDPSIFLKDANMTSREMKRVALTPKKKTMNLSKFKFAIR